MSGPKFVSTNLLAERAGVSRATAIGLLARGAIVADAQLDVGNVSHPLFLENRVVDLLKALRRPKSGGGGLDRSALPSVGA